MPVYSQEITSFDTKSIDLQDILMPNPLSCFSIMELLDIPYIQYLIATKKMKQDNGLGISISCKSIDFVSKDVIS